MTLTKVRVMRWAWHQETNAERMFIKVATGLGEKKATLKTTVK